MQDKSNSPSRCIDDESQSLPGNEEIAQRLISEFSQNLRELSPQAATARYLKSKRSDITPTTRVEYESKLDRFEEFCEREGITSLNDLDGRRLDDYALWLRYEASDQVDELSAKTMRDEMYLLRGFVSYLEKIEAVKRGLSTTIEIPDTSDGEGVRNIDMDPARVRRVLDYLGKYEYASLEHIVWLLPVRVGRRTGGIISLDVGDAHLDTDEPYLEFRHRPPETRLKNKKDGEGPVAIANDVAEVLKHYIDEIRPDVTDEAGREPLLATSRGRISKSTFRRYLYKWSRPCSIGRPCPHERDPAECKATKSLDHASKCPSSRSPHALRHGFISEGLRSGIPIEVLSDRCDVSQEVIREVYDETTEEERLNVRREILDEYADRNGGGYL